MNEPRVGDWVILAELPPWVGDLPEESRAVFDHCVGHAFRVTEIDGNRNLVLDVSALVDPVFSGDLNDVRVESRFVRSTSTRP
ncbi:MAG: hypothetical protein HKM89_04040 [Gemmatimonadales bacterium]|nr:hypothetical protein [Gemmatimonadales bacterium]